jgi:2-C-methyl-D-erythritol 4-phosphate cytidylyltransferase
VSLRAAVVPVLASRSGVEAEPLSAVLLFGEPLYVHATRALSALPGARVLVTTATGRADAVRDLLVSAGLPWARVDEVGPVGSGVGAALVRALADLPPVLGDAAEHEVGVVLLHDPRCPLVPASCLHEVLERAVDLPGAVHAAARPVTDTVKSVDAGAVRATVDRDVLRVLASPLALPVTLLRRLDAAGVLAGCREPGELLDLARAHGVAVHWVNAPSLGRRVADAAQVGVLECFADVRARR